MGTARGAVSNIYGDRLSSTIHKGPTSTIHRIANPLHFGLRVQHLTVLCSVISAVNNFEDTQVNPAGMCL